MGTPWWATLAITLVGISGTLAGVALTQRFARLREDALAAQARDDERARWLRDQRLAIYPRLLRELDLFADAIYRSTDLISDVDQEGSPLFESRRRIFSVRNEAVLLSDAELQRVLRLVGGLAEDVGHEPYINEPKNRLASAKSKHKRRLWRAAYVLKRQAEEAIRAELGLPARRDQTERDDLWFEVLEGDERA